MLTREEGVAILSLVLTGVMSIAFASFHISQQDRVKELEQQVKRRDSALLVTTSALQWCAKQLEEAQGAEWEQATWEH